MSQKKIKPVFIIGSPRSGTSVLTWAIGQHPNIKQTPETVWIVSLLSGAFLSYIKGSERGRFSHLSNVDYSLNRFFERVGESIDTVVDDAFNDRCKLLYGETGYASRNPKNYEIKRSQDEPKSRWVDGTPLNTHYIWALSIAFPEAKFLHTLRDPLDVALSLANFDRVGQDAVSLELEKGLEEWMVHTRRARLAERALGSGKVLRVNYSQIESEPGKIMRQIYDFLGEEHAPDSLLPFNERVNSSRGVKKDHLSPWARLKTRLLLRPARDLYNEIQNSYVGMHENIALEEMKKHFEESLRSKSLIG
jgi:hypothetical protein